MGSSDEHFYIVEGVRLVNGDRLFFDDLFVGQSFGLFVMPFVWVYQMIVGSNEGIVLYMRIIYSLLHSLVGLLFYFHFSERYDSKRVFLAAVAYYLFTPFNIMALSYNTLSIGFMILASICFPWIKENNFSSFLAGLFYGCAVLNSPLLAIGYFLFVFIVIKKKNTRMKTIIWFSIGIGCIAILFLSFVFTRISFSQFKQVLHLIIDHRHSLGPLRSFIKSGGLLVYYLHVGFIGLLLLIILPILFRKSEKKELVLNVLFVISFLIIIWIGFIHTTFIDYGGFAKVLIPFALLGFAYQLLFDISFELKAIYWISIFHAFAVSLSSDVGPDSYSCPLITSCMMTILMMKKGSQSSWKYMSIGFLIVLGYFNIFCFYQGPRAFETMAKAGPCKGLYDTNERITVYEGILKDFDSINKTEGEHIVLVSSECWQYLATTKKVGSGWAYPLFWNKEDFENMLDIYIQLHEKVAPYLYIQNDNSYQMTKEDPWLSNHSFIEEMSYGILYKW